MNRQRIISSLSLIGLFFITACAPTATLDYTPTTTAEVKGTISINPFEDLRGAEIERNDINQVNTLTGRDLYLTQDVSEIITTATRREFRQAGISLRGAHCVLDGEVNNFSFEMLAFARGFKYYNDIHYILKGPASKVLYERDINRTYEAGVINLHAIGSDLNQSLSKNINDLLTDTRFVSVVEQNCK